MDGTNELLKFIRENDRWLPFYLMRISDSFHISRIDAEDIYQQLCFNVVKGRTFEKGNPLHYLSIGYRHLCCNYLRNKRRGHEVNETSLLDEDREPMDYPSNSFSNPLAILIETEERERFKNALENRRLGKRSREMLLLKYEGLSDDEISIKMGVNRASVRQLFNAAKKSFRAFYGDNQ